MQILKHLLMFAIFIQLFQCEVLNTEKNNEPIKPLPEYTKDNAREWESIADEHDLIVSKVNLQKPKINMSVRLKKPSVSHYIEVFGIMSYDRKKQYVAKSVKRLRNPKLNAQFSLDNLPQEEELKAFAKCNLHDLWVKTFTIKSLN